MRSPSAMPSETSASSGRTPYALETRSRLRRLAIRAESWEHVGTGHGTVGDQDHEEVVALKRVGQ